jgi:membrane-associated phospholipid phosphatase
VLALAALLSPGTLLASPDGAKGSQLLSMRPGDGSPTLELPAPRPLPPDTRTPLVPPPSTSPFNVKLSVDLPITLGAPLGIFLPQMIGIEPQPPPPDLRADQLNSMDRGVVGNWSPAADRASDALLATTIVLPFAASLIDTWVSRPGDGYRGFLKDALVLAETYAITTLITNIVKMSVNRPRPYVYDVSLSPEVRSSGDATRSFFSGHASTAFAMATSYSYMFMMRHPRSKLVIPIWIGTHALATATALLRVEAGRHFWSDILVGAAVGSAIGLAVPYLHKKNNFLSRLFFGRKRDRGEVHLSVGAGLGLTLSGKF